MHSCTLIITLPRFIHSLDMIQKIQVLAASSCCLGAHWFLPPRAAPPTHTYRHTYTSNAFVKHITSKVAFRGHLRNTAPLLSVRRPRPHQLKQTKCSQEQKYHKQKLNKQMESMFRCLLHNLSASEADSPAVSDASHSDVFPHHTHSRFHPHSHPHCYHPHYGSSGQPDLRHQCHCHYHHHYQCGQIGRAHV